MAILILAGVRRMGRKIKNAGDLERRTEPFAASPRSPHIHTNGNVQALKGPREADLILSFLNLLP